MARTLVGQTKDTRKNWFINGAMEFGQRGTSFTSITNQANSLDRFQYIKSGATVHNLTQDTDVPTTAQAGYAFQNSLRLTLTTPDNSIAAGDYAGVGQIIEGFNWKNLAQNGFTISFWVKATTVGTYCIGMQNSAADRGYAAEYTINTTGTWEYKTVTIPASPAAGTWNYTNGVGLKVWWMLACGSTFQFATGAWQTGTVLSTANQVNGVATGATDFRLTGVMINAGSTAAPFRLYAEGQETELLACQRYYEKSYDNGTNPASATENGATQHFITTTAYRESQDFRVTKRTIPTVIVYSTVTGATAAIRNRSDNADVTSVGQDAVGTKGYSLSVAVTINKQYSHHFTAEAELS